MTTMYTPDHEWINIEDHEAATVGITHHAQDALGDVVFVDLPEVGRTFKKGEVAGVVESVKAAADLFMPVTGEVVEVNEALRDDPELVNDDPYGDGWLVPHNPPDADRRVPMPLAVCFTRIAQQNPLARALPRTYIYCKQGGQDIGPLHIETFEFPIHRIS